MRILLATLLLAVIPAYGSIIVFSGVTVLPSAPPSLMPGQLLSDTTIVGFLEQTDVLLTSSVTAAITSPGTYVCCGSAPGGSVPAGETVNSYLLRYAPETGVDGQPGRAMQGQISFSPGEQVVAIIVGAQHIALTDAMLGAPGTNYPPGSYDLGGLEGGEEIVLGPNMSSVFMNLRVAPGQMDMIRILTTTPEPADFLLIGSGLVVLAFWKRRKLGRAVNR